MDKLKGLKPDRVFYYFEEISKIPRCSYEERKISNYLKSMGEKLGLETIQDEMMNIIIRKPASKGYENSSGVIIQGHMDMVCEKEEGSTHNFQKDPIDLIVEGDFIKADKTTLGADNGIALAMGLAILEDESLEHPSLELLVTTAEEIGMDGALGLSDSVLRGKRLFNVDSEEEGILTTGSAGGELVDVRLPAKHEDVDNLVEFSIEVRGLLGGHSGMEIDKGRLNAHKILTKVLRQLKDEVNYYLVSFKGGNKDNSIPRTSIAHVAVKEDEIKEFKERLEKLKEEIIQENKEEEKDICIEEKEKGKVSEVLSKSTRDNLLELLNDIPTGVYTRLKEDNSIVESSSNLAIVNLDKEKFVIQTSTRSSNPDVLLDLRKEITDAAKNHNAEYNISNEYPEWEFREKSELRDTAIRVYKEVTGKEMETTVIHAGLESGVFAKKYPDIDIISFGPNMKDVHTPEEKLSISSAARTFEYLKALLKALK
ncbi:aminoacyl-histidine dipeptidase [Tissierella creatinophila]|uniref:Cytosol non-specific dipeptidase n=1 Tax=Tissierella creatinophila DSM 6911 TaxID=1123403 RepID=A0A1U7M8K9_TISCR|nr:aminoacyl-histidine dipeptidase [Tissierella creatinophila]OLS03663.1 cytosol non-specific dipeptidase [Tissierella creatinophila DSM 6911]